MPRIAVIADIHHGAHLGTKRGDAALGLLAEFARFVADARPDLVIDLGDRISDVDAEADRALQAEVARAFRAVPAPVHHLDGNHDLAHLDAAANAAILGRERGSETLDLGAWRLALWRAHARIEQGPEGRGFRLGDTDLAWLAETARGADRPLLVASHVPVSDAGMTGNHYFERNPRLAGYPEAPEARAALAGARVPVVCLAGHVHWNTVSQVDGIAHLTQQSLTESFTTDGEPAAAWGLLELDDTLRWEVLGRDPFRLELRPEARRWRAPLAPFGTEDPEGIRRR